MIKDQRLDQALVKRGLVETRSRARDLILRGAVAVDGRAVRKPAQTVRPQQVISLTGSARQYVARSSVKLAAALDEFFFSPKGLVCLDVGASTGGFTQVLLGGGARKVYAVDVGQGQLHATLLADKHVVNMQGVNARDVSSDMFDEAIAAIVVDVSFISVLKVLPAILSVAGSCCWLVCLIKPQFEVERDGLGKGGIVKDAAKVDVVLEAVQSRVSAAGWRVVGVMPSPILGKDGNQEFLMGAVFDG